MITVIPKIRHIESQLKDAKEWVSNLGNKSLATQMTDRFEQYHCKDHPNFENIMEVDLYNEHLSITIETVCCKRFKEYLDLVSDNKDPFTSNEGFAF